MNPVQMTDIQTLSAVVAAQDADGNPTPLQAPIAATLSDPTFGMLAPAAINADGTQTIVFHPATVAGKLGAVTISLTTVAPDQILTASISVNITASAAAQLVPQVTVA